MHFFADLQMMTDKAGGPQLAAQLENFPSYQISPLLRWSKPTASIIYYRITEHFALEGPKTI